jgi:integrase/recombinase XerC
MLKESKFLDSWLEFLENNKRYSKNTVDSYRFDILDLFKFNSNHLKRDSFSEFKTEDIYDWLLARKNTNDVCSRTNCRAISALKNFFAFLEKNKIFIPDELLFIKRPKFSPKLPRPVSLKEIQFSNILELGKNGDWLEIQDKSLLMLMYGCGLRISEALGVKIPDIDFEQMFLKVCNAKGSKERIVPLIKFALDSLLDHLIHCPFLNIDKICGFLPHEDSSKPKNYKEYSVLLKKIQSLDNLFFCQNGKKLTRNYFSLKLKKLLPVYNLPYGTSAHSFRHSFAGHLLENGANIKQIQSLLGHSRLSSSEVYTKVSNNLLRKMYSASHPKAK